MKKNNILNKTIKKSASAIVICMIVMGVIISQAAFTNRPWTERQEKAHAIAEQAREMGLSEDNPIIMEAKRIWQEEEDAKSAPEMIYLGKYYITGYDTCIQCCGKTDGITASGTRATVGRTVAAAGFSFATKIYIDGIGERIVEDRGPGYGVIDVLCNNHTECYALTGWYDVYEVAGK